MNLPKAKYKICQKHSKIVDLSENLYFQGKKNPERMNPGLPYTNIRNIIVFIPWSSILNEDYFFPRSNLVCLAFQEN